MTTAPAMRGRYAPSPTGETHLGNARTALLAWLQVREHNGVFVLRLEDLDTGRVRPGMDDALLRDLAWLGLDWDEAWDVGGPHGPYRQSERLQTYQAALERLPTYPCSCSRKEIAEEIASAPHGPEQPYPGTCRDGGPKHPMRPLSRRLRAPPGSLSFEDVRLGPHQSDLEDIGDFVLQRNDGVFAYQLACALDDAAMQITHVTRGEDLLHSTPRQILILQLLGLPAPQYCHVPLLRDVAGERLAKRNGGQSLRALRDGGATPQRVVRELAQSLGWDVPHDCTPKDLLGFFGAWLPGQINA